MCNWLVGLAFFFTTQGRDNTSKIYGIWVLISAFVALGYQHSIANYFMVPIGMFYGTNFGVGKFIWASIIPVTIGNIIGGALFGGIGMWAVYGRHEVSVREEKKHKSSSSEVQGGRSDESYHAHRHLQEPTENHSSYHIKLSARE